MTGKPQIFTPTGAEKAFIYQQTQDLVSFLNDAGPVSVLIEKHPKTHNSPSSYAVTFIFSFDPLSVQAQGQGNTLISACVSAKNQMKKKILNISHHIGNLPQRNKMIEKLKKYTYIQ